MVMTEQRSKQDIINDYELKCEREYSVTKDNRLIQTVVRRKYELTVLEQKLLCYLLSKIRPDDVYATDRVYQFEIRQFCKVCGIDYDNGKNYRNVKAALDKLADNAFWLDYGEGEFRFQWITTPDIQKGKGLIEIEIPKKVMPFLCNLSEKFTTYQLYNILALKSSYSIMLYELFKSWSYKNIFTVPIVELRRYLGIDESKYVEFKAFRRAVLERCIKEIETYTDIRVQFRPIRKGRSYTSIEFEIHVLDGWESVETYRRTMAEINGVKYTPGQIHLFE